MLALDPLTKAIRLFGGHKKLASAIGCSRQSLYDWRKGNLPLPPEKAILIEEATKGEVTREQLRPDLYRSAA